MQLGIWLSNPLYPRFQASMSSIDEIFSTFDEAFSNVPILYNGNTFNRVDEVDSVNKVKSIKRLTVTLKLVTWNYGFLTFNLKFLDQITSPFRESFFMRELHFQNVMVE